MSIHQSVFAFMWHQHFQNLRLRDCWADVYETWYVYSTGRNLEFWPLHCLGEMTLPERSAYFS